MLLHLVRHSRSELIDTCWNVNEEAEGESATSDNELIDTCWNVNIIAPGITHLSFLELIDTCWNVNYFIDHKESLRRTRINRYMLECKLELDRLSGRSKV